MRTVIVLLWAAVVGIAAAQDVPACDPDAPLAHGAASTSPDGRYTVYFECYNAGATTYTVYAHDAETDETVTLGETAPDLVTATMYVARWLPEAQVVIRAETGGGTYNWRSVYIAGAGEADSLVEAARDYVARPRYGDNPPRYEWAVEDGISERFAVYRYDVESGERSVIYEGGCLLRDDNADALSCHMVTPNTNETYTDDAPTRLILNIGDSAREIKTVAVRTLPTGNLIYSVDTLGGGYADWLSADTIAVFNLAFDMESGGFAGKFVRFDEDNAVVDEEPFTVGVNDALEQRPSWLTKGDG